MLASAFASTTSASTEAVRKLLHVLSKNIQLQADSGLLESTNMKIMVTQLLEPLTAEEKRVHKAWANKKYRDNSRHGVQRTDVVAIQGDVLLSCDRETDGTLWSYGMRFVTCVLVFIYLKTIFIKLEALRYKAPSYTCKCNNTRIYVSV